MNISKTPRFRSAIKKVRQYCRLNGLTIGMVTEKEAISKFFESNNIEYVNQKKELKELLYELAVQKHKALDFKIIKKPKYVKEKTFYDTDEWNNLRKRVLKFYGIKCMKCKATNTEMHVDHIKPRSKYPELEMCFDNLQVLCKSCNKEKSNKNEIDYRNL
jgi:5-methylcytosine-specific restriction endonuclease McrA